MEKEQKEDSLQDESQHVTFENEESVMDMTYRRRESVDIRQSLIVDPGTPMNVDENCNLEILKSMEHLEGFTFIDHDADSDVPKSTLEYEKVEDHMNFKEMDEENEIVTPEEYSGIDEMCTLGEAEEYPENPYEQTEEDKEKKRLLISRLMSLSFCSSEEESTTEIGEIVEPTGHLPSIVSIKKISIDREDLFNEYHKLIDEQMPLRRQNGYLNRKLTEYYKKRKMDHALQEGPASEFAELTEKYERKLTSLDSFQNLVKSKTDSIVDDLKHMTEHRNELKAEKERIFKFLQQREKETSKDLVDSRTGKVLSDKVVEKLINRQRSKMEEISGIRLEYIKRRDRVKELEMSLKALETIGGSLHLMDYEQLRVENQNYSDKIEERDEEMNRLRIRCTNAVKVLAHIREKSYRIDKTIVKCANDCIQEENVVTLLREKLNALKLERDANRSEYLKLKGQTGILTYPKLINDMKASLNEISKLTKECESLQKQFKNNRDSIFEMRATIDKNESSEAGFTIPSAPKNSTRSMDFKSRVTIDAGKPGAIVTE